MADQGSQSKYAGMTVNERLFVAGILHAFDGAARRRDRAAMIDLLERVDLTHQEAQQSVDALLADPGRYKY